MMGTVEMIDDNKDLSGHKNYASLGGKKGDDLCSSKVKMGRLFPPLYLVIEWFPNTKCLKMSVFDINSAIK